MRKIISASSSETQEIGKKLAREFFKKEDIDNATVISLEGDLGGGKTTFAKGFARGLSVKKRIKSPTFVIMRRYKIKIKNKIQDSKLLEFKNLYHFDCYRIKRTKEILDLGWEKTIKNSQNIILVEWGEKIRSILPKDTLHIKFDFLDKNKRKITFT